MQRANHSLSNDQLHARSIQQPHPHPHPHRAACTHVRASRVFNEQVLCNHCGRPGNMGWVYRCTQDSDGRVPIDESGLDESEQYRLRELASRNGWALPGVDPAFTERMFRAEKNHNNIADLKPWMRKAASSREYTPLQITKLITQRMEVERTIWIQEMSTKDNKSVPQTAGRQQREITTGKPASVHTTGLDGQEIGASKDCVEVDMEKNLADLMAETYRKPSLCDYKCCAACRPIMRDRAWLAIDSVIHPEDADMFPDDIDIRPMASATIILGINSFNHDTDDTSSTSLLDHESAEDSPTESNDHRRSALFLDNVRQMYQDYSVDAVRRSTSTNSRSHRSSLESSHSDEMDITDTTEDERMAALSVERPESRMGDSWMAGPVNVSILPPRILRHMRQDSIANIVASAASHSALPVQETRANGELHIGAGVAVTEEAVDLGMADIITQS